MRQYEHLTTEEREKAMVMQSQGFSIRAIARILKRSASTISREFKRNTKKSGEYSAAYAGKQYKRRRKQCHRKRLLDIPELSAYVQERLHLKWSPEQIAGRAKLDNYPISFSYNTIYRAVARRILPISLHKDMRLKRGKRLRTDDKRKGLKDFPRIADRPEEVNTRETVGHWESDTVHGKRNTGDIVTHVERKTGYLVARKVPNHSAEVVNEATISAFSKLPRNVKNSFTVDRGAEFFCYKELAEKTGMPVFFCDPYSPWQRGSNENTNGLLRQFFPKGTSFSLFSEEQLEHVVSLINNRPRKRLGWFSPNDFFLLHLA